MLHYDLTGSEVPSEGRQQPWESSNHRSPGQWYNFKEDPEQISTVLEEFTPWAHYQAIQTFYDLIRWANGPSSELETSDCMLDGPGQNASEQFPKALQIVGRLVFFNRDLAANTREGTFRLMMLRLGDLLRGVDPEFRWGCIAKAPFNTLFLEPSGTVVVGRGCQILLKFWAWGDDEQECMANLDRTFTNMRTVLEALSTDIAAGNLEAGN